PSGERSRLSQVPSSVVNLRALLGVSGRPAPRPPVVSLPRPPRWASAGVEAVRIVAPNATERMRRRILRLCGESSGGQQPLDSRFGRGGSPYADLSVERSSGGAVERCPVRLNAAFRRSPARSESKVR